ncbi:hypothetical protein B0H16DRAFT_971533 [Mycena metata]|uniref:Arrestin-like N-terminal domain-containing protein n=1 Tax=Mycena metata TaxID=1033252 RepID=A0AAD7N4X3_9AGAR|nr:hypothetical protein B0H16DRAFT_971533 [Mycena metata]
MADYVQRIVRTLDSMDPTIPPSYDGTTHSAPGGLPSYTRSASGTPQRRVPTEHQYHLASRSKPPWATLTVFSRAPTPGNLLTFLEGDKITGTFTFNLGQAESITSVSAVARGQIFPGPAEREALTFVEVKSTLWSKENGDPRSTGTSRFSGKLVGYYEWPFTLELPTTVTIPGTNHFRAGTVALPQTFLERRFPTSVQYVLVVDISRSRFRVNSKVQTMFAYVPATRPPPPSPLRQLAYQENTPLLGPDADPAGWEQFPSFVVRGTVFSTRRVEATCHFALAKPLCYTRGAPIPCAITLSSTDVQALDLLSAPRAISVHLRRRLKPLVPASKRNGMFDANADLSADPAENIAAATWWPSLEGAPENTRHGFSRRIHRRRLDGEIQLPVSLKPSCRIAHFAVEYTVEVLPFKATAFVSADTNSMLRQSVEVVTMFASNCPRPRAYAPPQYNLAQEEARDTYFNADGLSHVWRT